MSDFGFEEGANPTSEIRHPKSTLRIPAILHSYSSAPEEDCLRVAGNPDFPRTEDHSQILFLKKLNE